MVKSRKKVLYISIIAISLITTFILLNFLTNIFGTQAALIQWFGEVSYEVARSYLSVRLLFPLTYANPFIIVTAGALLTIRRYKFKSYPFIIIAWILPTILLPVWICFLYYLYVSPTLLEWLLNNILIVSSYLVFPSVILTFIARLLRKKSFKDEVSVRTTESSISFPIERELIFISYATVDSDFYQIPKFTKILTSYPEINEILYWESDLHDDIYRYMDINLKRCKVVLLFCSKNSLYSEAVNMEWSSALKLNKILIPIFTEPDTIPTLLTTKLALQFNQDDPYTTIEDLYQIILKMLEVESVREFTKFLIPKWITENDFNELNPEFVEESFSFESDIELSVLGNQIASILQNNNFYVPGLEVTQKSKKAKKKPLEKYQFSLNFNFNKFNAFAELKDDPEIVAISIEIVNPIEILNKVHISLKGKRNWVLREIRKDINMKFIGLKSIGELIQNYSKKVCSLLEGMRNPEHFLRKYFGSNMKIIEDVLKEYTIKEISEEEFVSKSIELIGKGFIIVFIKNMHAILKEKKQASEKHST